MKSSDCISTLFTLISSILLITSSIFLVKGVLSWSQIFMELASFFTSSTALDIALPANISTNTIKNIVAIVVTLSISLSSFLNRIENFIVQSPPFQILLQGSLRCTFQPALLPFPLPADVLLRLCRLCRKHIRSPAYCARKAKSSCRPQPAS